MALELGQELGGEVDLLKTGGEGREDGGEEEELVDGSERGKEGSADEVDEACSSSQIESSSASISTSANERRRGYSPFLAMMVGPRLRAYPLNLSEG